LYGNPVQNPIGPRRSESLAGIAKGFGSPPNDLGDPSSAMTKWPDAAHPCLLVGSARWLALSCFC
jgi:hypothetical protein